MGLILAIESATKICSVALYKNDLCIDWEEIGGAYSHAENLAPFCKLVLGRNQIDISELDAIAVSKGPGSYTGLRIGVAFAKGLCFSNNIPLISIDTLEALAHHAIQKMHKKKAFYAPMIDARRMEIYTAIFDQESNRIESTSAKIITKDSFLDELEKQELICVGDGASKIKGVINHPNLTIESGIEPTARSWSPLLQKAFQERNFENIAYFEPYYLKEFIATKSKPLL